MGRYANRTIRFDFPDLSEDEDLIYVVIRNPKTMSADSLMPEDVETDAEGKPVAGAEIAASFKVMSGMIVDWHVYDGEADEDSPALELPATPDKLRSLPFEITQKIASAIGDVITTPR